MINTFSPSRLGAGSGWSNHAGCSDSQTPKSEEIQLGGVRGEPLSLRIGNPLRLESAGRWAGRRSRSPTRPLRRWRPSTFARAVVLHALGRFATWSRRGPRRRPVAGQSGAFETRAIFASSHHCRILAAVHAAHELSITSFIWCSVKHPQSVRTQAVCPESVCALVPEVVSEMATIAEFGLRS